MISRLSRARPRALHPCEQVSLFVEQRRVHEQGILYKELRAENQRAMSTLSSEMRKCERALLRARQAHLRGAQGSSTIYQLNQLPLADQVSEAISWAEDQLSAVKGESQMKLDAKAR